MARTLRAFRRAVPLERIRTPCLALAAFALLCGCGCGGGDESWPPYTPPPTDEFLGPCDGSEQISVFDDSDVLDDQFDVFVDGRFLFRTPVGAGAVNDTCLTGIPSGQHTLRIRFVQDIDDPSGTDPDSFGTYAVDLRGGVVFLGGPGVTGPTAATGDLFPPGSSDVYEILVP